MGTNPWWTNIATVVPSQNTDVVDTQDYVFVLIFGACFVVFAGPFLLANKVLIALP